MSLLISLFFYSLFLFIWTRACNVTVTLALNNSKKKIGTRYALIDLTANKKKEISSNKM